MILAEGCWASALSLGLEEQKEEAGLDKSEPDLTALLHVRWDVLRDKETISLENRFVLSNEHP